MRGKPLEFCWPVPHGAAIRKIRKSPAGWWRLVGATLLALGCVVQPACGQRPEGAARDALIHLARGQSLLESKKFAEAIEKAQAALAVAGELPTQGRDVGLTASIFQRVGELLYRAGDAEASLVAFDQAIELNPESAPHNWQRGIALCTCDRWPAGAEQFKTHHDVNPDDVENSAWYFLCIAKTKGLEAARQTVIPSRGDGREPMMTVLKMLQAKAEPEDVLQAAIDNTSPGARRAQAQFYGDLYVGLYYDCLEDSDQAIKYLKRSLTYGTEGYMEDVARVYLEKRFLKSE